MNRLNFRKIAPYLGIFAAFVLLSYAYTPELLSGKIVNQSDISSWQGMAQEIVSYNQSHPNDRALDQLYVWGYAGNANLCGL